MMHIGDLTTDDAVLRELGGRLERHRVERNLTQYELAEQAGLGRATLQRIERGESVQVLSLIKLLRALGLLDGLEATVPAAADLPIAQLERARRPPRKRVRRTNRGPGRPWTWGDDPAGDA